MFNLNTHKAYATIIKWRVMFVTVYVCMLNDFAFFFIHHEIAQHWFCFDRNTWNDCNSDFIAVILLLGSFLPNSSSAHRHKTIVISLQAITIYVWEFNQFECLIGTMMMPFCVRVFVFLSKIELNGCFNSFLVTIGMKSANTHCDAMMMMMMMIIHRKFWAMEFSYSFIRPSFIDDGWHLF